MTPPPRHGRRAPRLWLALAIPLVLNLSPPAAAQEIRYLYDELNRLIGVIDPQGNAAEYVYDAVGNILQIRRFNVDPSAHVSITLVRPSRGSPGETVQLFGRGFSPTPAENHVSFHGAAASVTAATATSVTVTVPSGATTGLISLMSPVGSATSPELFTVVAFTVVPAVAQVALRGSVGFQAVLDGAVLTDITWRVNGIVGGDATVGTIGPGGLYTAPAALPPAQPLEIEAVRTSDPTAIARASVQVVGQVSGYEAAAPVTVGPRLRTSPIVAGPLIVGPVPTSAPLASNPLTVSGGPLVLSVTPASAARGSTGLAMTLTGGNLQGATAVRFLRDGKIDGTLTASGVVTAAEGTSLTLSVTISGSAATGTRVVQVVTPPGTSTDFPLGTNVLTVTGP